MKSQTRILISIPNDARGLRRRVEHAGSILTVPSPACRGRVANVLVACPFHPTVSTVLVAYPILAYIPFSYSAPDTLESIIHT